jgi:hypothetical protein
MFNNPMFVGGVILLALALGDRTVQIITGIVLVLIGVGTIFVK